MPGRHGHPGSAAAPPGGSPEAALDVRALTTAAKELVEGAFPPLWVRGEVSDFKAHRNGHWYFQLRDQEAQLRCVVWSAAARRLPAAPDDGMQVVALGQMTVWPVRGDLQFSIRQLEAAGDGLWRKALERTRLRLEADGLLDPARKRPLPRFPRCLAVVTSPDGAAMHDIISVARARSADVQLVVVPARVQGEGAAESLVAALERVYRWGGADALIIGRGGGAREDLWAFNDEQLARVLAASPIPTVSAVGHEVDMTICDLVADVRAATPSAAAELAVPARREVAARVAALASRLAGAAQRHEQRAGAALRQVRRALVQQSVRVVEQRGARLGALAGQLEALSPLATLHRGYSVARSPDGASLKRRDQFAAGQPFSLWLHDGIVDAMAIGTHPRPDRSPGPPPEEHG